MDLRAIQAVPICANNARTMRVWFNDGRVRDFDCWPMIRNGQNRYKLLEDEETFTNLMSVFGCGAPGFDFGGNHDECQCMDFDPYEIWVEGKDVTRLAAGQDPAAI